MFGEDVFADAVRVRDLKIIEYTVLVIRSRGLSVLTYCTRSIRALMYPREQAVFVVSSSGEMMYVDPIRSQRSRSD